MVRGRDGGKVEIGEMKNGGRKEWKGGMSREKEESKNRH